MNLKQFAKKAGVKIVLSGPGWDGRYAYTEEDYPNCTTCGFKSHAEAYKHWAISTFGEKTAAALFKLLET